MKFSKIHSWEIEKEDRCNDDDDDDDDIKQACLCVHIQSWHNTLHPMKQFNSLTTWNPFFQYIAFDDMHTEMLI